MSCQNEAAYDEFMELKRQKVANMNPVHVVNMDQMPIPFTFQNSCISSVKGPKTAHMQLSTSDTKRMTLVATVIMNAEVLFHFSFTKVKKII